MYNTANTKNHRFEFSGYHARSTFEHRFFGQKPNSTVSIVHRAKFVEVTLSCDLIALVSIESGGIPGVFRFRKDIPQVIFTRGSCGILELREPYDERELLDYEKRATERDDQDYADYKAAIAIMKLNREPVLAPCTCRNCTKTPAV